MFWQEQKERRLLWLPVVLGFCLWAYFNYCGYDAPWFLKKDYTNCSVQGTIIDIEEFSNRQRITLSRTTHGGTKLKLSVPKKYPLRLNDIISGKADLMAMTDPPTPYSYDVRKDAYFKKIAGFGRMRWLYIQKRGAWSFRQYLQHQLQTHLKQPASYGIAKAIVLGDKSTIDLQMKEAFSTAGIAHLLAISGLHLVLFSGLIFFLIRMGLCFMPKIAHQYNTKKCAAILSLCFAILYMAVSGCGYPVVRATVMFGFMMVAIVIDRTALSMRSVALAATFILLLQPHSVLSVSFLLSFAAVIGLIAFFESANYWQHSWTWSMITSTIVTSLITMPICAVVFHTITLLSLIGNLIAIPWFTYVVMPLGMLSVQIHPYFYTWWEKSLDILIYMANIISTLPGGKIYVPPPVHNWPLLMMTFGILWLCIWQKPWRYLGLVPVVLGILCYTPAPVPLAFHDEHKDIHAIRQGNKLIPLQKRRGKYILQEWAKVYNLELCDVAAR